MKNRNVTFTTILLALGCFALCQQAQAVSPAPDGCYPGFTTAEGCNALRHLTSGAGNAGVGWYSLFSVTTGNYNTGLGAGTLVLNTADSNTAVGTAALLLNTSGSDNTAVGTDALVYNDNGTANTAIGFQALTSNTTGNSNVAVGIAALPDNTSGIENAAVGGAALFTNIDGHDNVAVGQAALSNNTHGNNNIGIGLFGGQSVTTSSNVICIGTQGQDMSNSCFIGQIFGATVPGASNVVIDANNRLGTLTSSKRFKDDIKPMDRASEALYALEPVAFHYKKEIDPVHISQLGLVAEDVEKVNPDLVVRDNEGKPYSVRYDQVNAMLLNEFLKEHCAFVGEQHKIAQQQEEIDALKTELKKQRSLIQKVSDKVELKRSTPRVVVNNQ